MSIKKKIGLIRLSKRETAAALGGYVIECDEENCCGCGCFYENSGGSSTSDNQSANYSSGLYSPR